MHPTLLLPFPKILTHSLGCLFLCLLLNRNLYFTSAFFKAHLKTKTVHVKSAWSKSKYVIIHVLFIRKHFIFFLLCNQTLNIMFYCSLGRGARLHWLYRVRRSVIVWRSLTCSASWEWSESASCQIVIDVFSIRLRLSCSALVLWSAYTRGSVPRLLELVSRPRGGVLQTATFIWFHRIDTRLFFFFFLLSVSASSWTLVCFPW